MCRMTLPCPETFLSTTASHPTSLLLVGTLHSPPTPYPEPPCCTSGNIYHLIPTRKPMFRQETKRWIRDERCGPPAPLPVAVVSPMHVVYPMHGLQTYSVIRHMGARFHTSTPYRLIDFLWCSAITEFSASTLLGFAFFLSIIRVY